MKPLIKWAGGKTRLLPTLREIIGTRPIGNYYEPFLGGGALYFDIWEKVRGTAWLSDVNEHLITMYKAVRDRPVQVVDSLTSLESVPYEQIRERFNFQDPATPQELKAARFIALNFLCFNGLWRVNKAGEFNVPIGKNGKGQFERRLCDYDTDLIRLASIALEKATLRICGFNSILVQPVSEGDLVFFDPPYLDTFSDYDASGFSIVNHESLRDQAKRFASGGARVILCGSNTELTRQVYGEPTILVSLNRTIGASKRGECKEALYLY